MMPGIIYKEKQNKVWERVLELWAMFFHENNGKDN